MRKATLSKIRTRLTGTLAVMLLTAGVFGGSSAFAAATTGITVTKHNLGTTGNQGPHLTAGTAEICVFCHTPHGADISASVPLWNRNISVAPTYASYNSLGTSSLDGATAPIGSVSIACLSCHDGTQAMNVMINQPGSGGYNPAGAAATGDAWSSGTGTMPAGIAMLNDAPNGLKNDHPIGIQYGGGPTSGSYTAPVAVAALYANTLYRDADFVSATGKLLNGSAVWWVDTPAVAGVGGNALVRDKTDMQLYTRDGSTSLDLAGAATAGTLTGKQPFVECASCHDPHVSANPTFLRIANTGSAVCLACHIK